MSGAIQISGQTRLIQTWFQAANGYPTAQAQHALLNRIALRRHLISACLKSRLIDSGAP